MFPMRDYQLEVYNSVQPGDMVVMPTGTGKSRVIAALAMKYADRRVLIVVPTVELKEQMYYLMTQWGIPADVKVWKSAAKDTHDVWIHDECHHTASASWEKLIEGNDRAIHIGFTATPMRLDGKPLAGFKRLIEPHPMGWYMERGYLCPTLKEYTVDLGVTQWTDKEFLDIEAQFERLDRKKIYGGMVENYRRYQFESTRSIVFGTTVEHCYKIRDTFNEAGVRSEVIHSGMAAVDRRARMRMFKDGEIEQLVNVFVLGEGVDVPDVNMVILLCPTNSKARYYQWVGRALRAGKPEARVLDFVGNLLRHGSVANNMGWKEDYEKALMQDKISQSVICLCGNCGGLLKYPSQTCPVCGYKKPKIVKAQDLPKELQGKLIEYFLTPFGGQIIKASGYSDPIKGANHLVKNKKLYQPKDYNALMNYLTQRVDKELAMMYYKEIAG
jgi:superfamily II DNA or RNA helicase